FGYDAAGVLLSVTDFDGNVTTIERDPSGQPTAIVGPYGQRTSLTLGPDANLASIQDPMGNTDSFDYYDGALLKTHTNPRGFSALHAYDAFGRITTDQDPAGGSLTVAVAANETSFNVSSVTAEGRTSSHTLSRENSGGNSTFESSLQPDGTTVIVN